MKRQYSRGRIQSFFRALVFFVIAAWVSVSANTIAIAADDVLDFVRFTTPAGWTAQTTASASRVLWSPSGENASAKILLVAAPLATQVTDLAKSFDEAVNGVFQGSKIVQTGVQAKSKTPEGYPFISQNFAADDAQGGRVFASVMAASVDGRMAIFGLISGSREGFDNHYATFNEFLRTISFTGPAAAQSKDDPLDRRNGRIEQPPMPDTVSNRTRSPAVNPAANPVALFPAPAKVLASEKSRMKPGIVSGNIYGADGKPWRMPGARATVAVWGVTGKEDIITPTGEPGGARTSYNIRVDENGHYELKIAGGGYRIRATALIPYGNVIVPVTLDPLDGEPSDDYDLNSFRGIVKDFGLKLTGPRAGGPDSGWNGFTVGVSDSSNILQRSWTRYPAGTHLHVLLTPIAPLLDGSQGWPVDIDFDLAYMGQHQDRDGCAWSGVPFAKYRVTAQYALPNGRTVPARVDIDHSGMQHSDSVLLEFRVENDRFTGLSVVMPTVYVNDER